MIQNAPTARFDQFDSDSSTLADLIGYAKQLLSTSKQHSLILDGVDELERDQESQVLHFLHELLQRSDTATRIFLTSRPSTQTRMKAWVRKQTEGHHLLSLESPLVISQVAGDVSTYIQKTLEDLLHSDSAFLGQPETIIRIRDTLGAKANGMYVYIGKPYNLWLTYPGYCGSSCRSKQSLRRHPMPRYWRRSMIFRRTYQKRLTDSSRGQRMCTS